MAKINVWNYKLIFLTDKLQQKMEMTDLKKNLSSENTSVKNNFGHRCL